MNAAVRGKSQEIINAVSYALIPEIILTCCHAGLEHFLNILQGGPATMAKFSIRDICNSMLGGAVMSFQNETETEERNDSFNYLLFKHRPTIL